jgi:hypothetical protein
MWRRAGVLSIVVLAITVPAASARIVVQHSIGGVSLGMTRAQVTGLLGPPVHDIAPTSDDSRRTRFWDFAHRLRIGFANDGDAVTTLVTYSHGERTASGVGPGSSRRAVKRALHGEHCTPDLCMVGTDALGEVTTIFDFNRRGRTTEVLIFQRESTYLP